MIGGTLSCLTLVSQRYAHPHPPQPDLKLVIRVQSQTSQVIDDVQGLTTFSQSGVDDSIRWYAPELINGKRELSIRSDIYSLGMTILELITGKQPWDNVKRSGQIVLKVANGVIANSFKCIEGY